MQPQLIWYWVADFDKMRDFYENRLELKILKLDESGGWAEYDSGLPNFHIAIHQLEDEEELETGVGGILTFTTSDILLKYQQFAEKNVDCDEIISNMHVTRFSFWDPEGNPFQMVQSKT